MPFSKTHLHQSFRRRNKAEILRQCQIPLREERTRDLKSPNKAACQCTLPLRIAASLHVVPAHDPNHSFKNRNQSRVQPEPELEPVMNRFLKKYIKYLNFNEKKIFLKY
jgi:hypothetical protein